MDAPVAVFAYNRPDHLRQTLEALARNERAKETDVIIFSDGPRSAEDAPGVEAVRRVIGAARGFKSVRSVLRPVNLGLARSIIDGVTEICAQAGRVIVVEDDLVTSPAFLPYMNAALDFYAEVERVISISAYIYPVRETLPETFFLRGAECWGWATWARGWRQFNPDGPSLLAEIFRRGLAREFSLEGGGPHLEILQDQVSGRNDSWAIRWHASAFLADRLTLYPGRSLVRNIGMDGSGRHCPPTEVYEVEPARDAPGLRSIPVGENRAARLAVARFFWRNRRAGPLLAQLRFLWPLLARLHRLTSISREAFLD